MKAEWTNRRDSPVTNEDKPKTPAQNKTGESSTKRKEAKAEEMVHVYMAWPESMKREFDILFLQNKRLRKRGKNEVLMDWCREGLKKERGQ